MKPERRLLAAVDTALDRSVVLGYTKVGSGLRRFWWPENPGRGTLAGQRVVVTGATSGIGEAMAASFAELGAIVHLVGRDEDKVKASAGRIRGGASGAQVIEEVCDVSDLDAVRAWTADLPGRIPALRGLVHNAGSMPPRRSETRQGQEVQLATHVLGPHLMTQQLLPLLRAAGGASVVWMSSGGMYTAGLVDDVESRDGYSGALAYARTKRMQVVLADAWASRLADDDVKVESMHPGWVATPGVTEYLPLFDKVARPLLRTATDGADTAVWLVATRPESRPGHFWHDRAQRPTTFGWQRPGNPGHVARFLRHICEMTATPTEWTGLRH